MTHFLSISQFLVSCELCRIFLRVAPSVFNPLLDELNGMPRLDKAAWISLPARISGTPLKANLPKK